MTLPSPDANEPNGDDSVSPEIIRRLAMDATGAKEPGEPELGLFLEKLVESFNRDAEASRIQRRNFRDLCVAKLISQIQIRDCLQRHPEIADVPVERPLFVTGLARSGTTLLHNLLALDPQNRPLRYWETLQILPPPDPQTEDADPRIARAERLVAMIHAADPQIKAIHYLDPRGPEECNSLLMNAFASNLFLMTHHTASYHDWLMGADLTPAYRFYKRQLQILAWKYPSKRWALKAPAHLFFLDALFAVFPDASVVQTHRDPAETIASACDLAARFRALSPAADALDPAHLGRISLSGAVRAAARGIAARARYGADRFVDIGYADLLRDPAGQVRRIYRRFDLAGDDRLERSIAAWLADHPRGKHGVHRYSLADYGLSRAQVNEAMADYLAAHGTLISPASPAG